MRRLASVLVLVAAGEAPAQAPGGDRPENAALLWNEVALATIRAEKTPPPVAARNLAVLHVALYDAVATATGHYRPLRVGLAPPGAADPEAAATAAAHRVLGELYPDLADRFDAARDDALDRVPNGPAKNRGVAHGREVAGRILRWRAADTETSRRSAYAPRPELGRWRPTPPDYREALLPGWAAVPGFALDDLTKFRPPGPPRPDSKEFAEAYRRVKAVGAANSPTRTREQTEIAYFWADGEGTVTPPGHWNRIARTVALQKQTSPAEAARLLALLNVAMADAAVVCWDCKFHFDYWRPVTAVREAGRLNDPNLPADPDWSPLLPTPPFPSYTSGHSSFSGAAAGALMTFFGTDEVRFSTTSDGLPGVSRAFDSFSAAAREAGLSRVYGGIHWDFDNADGLSCGWEVGRAVAKHHFRPRER